MANLDDLHDTDQTEKKPLLGRQLYSKPLYPILIQALTARNLSARKMPGHHVPQVFLGDVFEVVRKAVEVAFEAAPLEV